jgi:hypothetical protein
MTARAGKKTIWGASKRWERASLSMEPQLGEGGGMPRPRKLRVASARMVAKQDAGIRGTERACGLYKLALAGGEDLCADEAGVVDPSGQRECKDEVQKPRSEEGYESDGEEYAWKGKEGIGEIDVDEEIDSSSVKACQASGDCAGEERENENRRCNQQRDAGTEQRTGEDVASEFIGSKPMMEIWA